MARHKKIKGIRSKNGKLYVVISRIVIVDGAKKEVTKWYPTKLSDTTQNREKALLIREEILKDTEITDFQVETKDITLSDYADQFLEEIQRDIADTTYSTYFYRVGRIKELFGNAKLTELTEKDIKNFLDDLFIKKGYKPETVKDTRRVLMTILGNAKKAGLLKEIPGKDVKISKRLAAEYTKEKKMDDEVFLSYEEILSFLKHVEDHQLYELFYFTIFFGLRREEVLGIRWSYIDFTHKKLYINHTVTKGMHGVKRLNKVKSESSDRNFVLTDKQIEMLKHLKRKETVNRKIFGNTYIENDYVFKNDDGQPYHPDTPTKVFKKIIKSIPELPQKITFHGLRKSCASILVKNNYDLKAIQKWMGHKDIETTMKIYAKIKESEAKGAISEHLDDIIPTKNYDE
ncbi:MAG: tyrosine-type recombinase/integrase [Lachnospiraceae bacterium]|nr:tyrosine-type recombinase/integrase [Lachnospiraceae bacterium]